MPRDAALTARLGLDDSDVRRKIRAQQQNYAELLRENQRYKERLAQQNTVSRARELREEKAHNAALIAENRKLAAAMLAGSGPPRPAAPAMIRRGSAADIRGGMSGSGSAAAAMMARGGRGGGATNAGMGMLMLSQTVDDLQYVNEQGLRPIINNIAPLVMGLGGSTGLAGALQIVAVAVQFGVQMWDKWNAKAEIAANNSENLAKYQENLARAIDTARKAGEAAAEAETNRTARQDAGRAGMDRILDREQRLIDLQTELKKVEADRLTGTQRLRAEMDIAADAERARLTKDLATTNERLRIDSERLGQIRREITAAKEEIAALEALGSQQSNADKKRLAYLQGRLPGLTQTASDLDTRGGALFQRAEDLKQALGPEAEVQQKIQKEKLGQEIAKQGVTAVIDFLGTLKDHAKEAQDADKKAWSAEQKRQSQRKAMDEERARLHIDSLRATGKRSDAKAADELQKKLDVSNETDRLIGKGFSPQAADAMANQRADITLTTGKTKKPGRIHGAISQNRKTGLNGESFSPATDFAGFQDRSVDYFGLKEASTQKRTQQNLKLQKLNEGLNKAEAAGDKATVAELRALKTALITKLDELNNTTRGTTADQAKPADVR